MLIMNISAAKDYFSKRLKEKIDRFIEEEGDAYIKPSELSPREIQIKQLKRNMLEILQRDHIKQDLKEAVVLIRDRLPFLISPEEYEGVKAEFLQVVNDAPKTFQQIKDMVDDGFREVTFWQLMKFSEQTKRHMLNLVVDLFDKEHYEDAKKVSLFLLVADRQSIEGGVALGRCLDRLGRYQKAILVYKYLQETFLNDASCCILCAKSCARLGDYQEVKKCLEEGARRLQNDEEQAKIWGPVIEQIERLIE